MSFKRWQKLIANSTAKVVACTEASAYAAELEAGFTVELVADSCVWACSFSGKSAIEQAAAPLISLLLCAGCTYVPLVGVGKDVPRTKPAFLRFASEAAEVRN